MNRLLFAVVATLFAGPAFATHWVEIARSPAASAYVDLDSIRSSGDLAQSWRKIVMVSPKPGHAKTTTAEYSYRCSAHSSGLMSGVTFDVAGQVINNVTVDKDKIKFDDDIPDTFSYEFSEFVCTHRK